MYKHIIILLIIILFSSCSSINDPLYPFYSDEELMEFREIAWNDLSMNEIETVIILKEESKIQYATITRKDGIWYYRINDKNKYSFVLTNPNIDFRNDQWFVIVTINTSDDDLRRPIVVIIEPNVKQVFGRGIRL